MPRTLLAVDDNPDDIEVLLRAVKNCPDLAETVLTARDHETCLHALQEHPEIDCVLLDFSLPGRDGLKVLEDILGQWPGKPVVMITGQGSEEVAVEAMRLGAQDYVSKDSITPEGLRRAVTNAIERAGMAEKIREQRESLLSFAHVLVHDLRAPLRTIGVAIEWLIEDLPEDVAAEHAETLEFVSDGAKKMDELIVALRSYNEVDRELALTEEVDLGQVVDDLRLSLKADLDERNGSIVTHGSLPTLIGHPALISQLLQNLVGNGMKYNRSDAPEVTLHATDAGTAWRIEVSDNGIGIEEKFLRRIFEPFKRCHASQEFEGTGLGLATCRKIVERHGGELTCHSEVGAGSTFLIELPKRAANLSDAA